MSIRIHELAKKIGMDNKVLLSLLKERKFDVKSVSSTIDNISAEALVEELKSKVPEAFVSLEEEPEVLVPEAVKPKFPMVKSAEDVAREREERSQREKAELAASQAPAVESAPSQGGAPNPVAAPQPTVAAPPTPPPAAPSAAMPANPAQPAQVQNFQGSSLSRPAATPTPPVSAPKPPPSGSGQGSAPPALPPLGKSPPSTPVPTASFVSRPPVAPVPLRPPAQQAQVAAAARPPVVPVSLRQAPSLNIPGVKPAPSPAPVAPAPSAQPQASRSAPSSQPVVPKAAAPVSVNPGQRPGNAPASPRPASPSVPQSPAPLPVVPRPAAQPPPPPSGFALKPPALPSVPGVTRPPALPATPSSAAPAAAAVPGPDSRLLHLKPPIVVRDFATALGMKPFKLISELMEMGIFASMTQSVDETVAVKVAEKHGYLLEIKHRGEAVPPQQSVKEKEAAKKKKADEDEVKNLQPRPPVVCILGHVDHGKTSLLDAIRKANVAAGEAGGITQHIGAYQIEHEGKKITFLDTPGHAAFNKMRARGASLTDIAVLVVAADDGFMPQTEEALKHIKNAEVSLMVAVNKMDVKGANLDQVKSQMQQRGIAPEDWGGDTITVPVSALKGTGIPDLLEMLLLQAEVLELRSNPKAEASGIVIESQLDVGRGPLATVLINRGTLRVGDALVCGPHWCKVRAMFDDQGRNLKEAPPASPVRVIGWSGTPDCGATFKAVKNTREAEKIAEEEQQRLRKEAVATAAVPKDITVASLFAEIAANQQKTLKLIVKTDVFGSSEAVRHVLEAIKSNKVSLEIVSIDVGLITKNDVLMASTGGAVVLGFNSKLENGVLPVAKHHGVRIETYDIIYELGDKVREMMADLLEPDLKEVKLGAAEVRATFPLAKGFVAGCLITEGKVTRNATARLRRGREIVIEAKVATLKRFKDDANEVRAGLECGIKLGDFNEYKVGDLIECFEVQKVRAQL